MARSAAAFAEPAGGAGTIRPELADAGDAMSGSRSTGSGQSEEEYVHKMGDPLSPEVAGAALVELIRADAATVAPGYLLTGAGLQSLA
jgi:hypothetical protein